MLFAVAGFPGVLTACSGPDESVRRRFTEAWRWIAGLALLGALALTVGPAELYAVMRRAQPGWVLGVAALTWLWLLTGAFNVWILLRRLSPLSFGAFLPAYLHGWAVSLILPGQLGDATQILLLRRQGVAAGQSGAAYLLDKIVTLLWVVAVSVYGAGRYLPGLEPGWLLVLPAAVLVAGAIAAGILRRLRPPPGGFGARLRAFLDRLLTELREFRRHPLTVACNASLTLAKWILSSWMYLGAFRAFGFRLDFVAAATIPQMSSLVGYLPVSIAGLGTVEWTAAALFSRVGADAALVLSVYLLLRGFLFATALLTLVARRRKTDTGSSKPAAG